MVLHIDGATSSIREDWRSTQESRGLGDVYKRQVLHIDGATSSIREDWRSTYDRGALFRLFLCSNPKK